ncbi:hypothetical protein GOV08_00825 [Candidatus Woesearchaeota archaeon]|nr:hypothetical protein [Candidatus Woesearchaeota archaeon]
MSAEELKHKIRELFGKQITFNKEFDSYASTIKNLETNLLEWCSILKEGKIRPLFPPKLKDSVVFIKKIGSSNRCVVIKIMNKEYKEVHLGDHNYYDKLRKILGLKKDSKTY